MAFVDVVVKPSRGAWGRLVTCSSALVSARVAGMLALAASDRPADGVVVIIRALRTDSALSQGRVVRFLLNQP